MCPVKGASQGFTKHTWGTTGQDIERWENKGETVLASETSTEGLISGLCKTNTGGKDASSEGKFHRYKQFL